jgi:hypothetical protein
MTVLFRQCFNNLLNFQLQNQLHDQYQHYEWSHFARVDFNFN